MFTFLSLVCGYDWTSRVLVYQGTTRSGYELTIYPFNHWLFSKTIVVITSLAIGYGVFGEDFFITTGPWCWIKGCMEKDKVINWMALTGKGWEVATYFLTMTFYLIIKFYMVRRVRLYLYSLKSIELFINWCFLRHVCVWVFSKEIPVQNEIFCKIHQKIKICESYKIYVYSSFIDNMHYD